MTRRYYDLPPFVHHMRPGARVCELTLAKHRCVLLASNNFQSIEHASKQAQKIMAARQEKIDRADRSALKQLQALKKTLKE